MSLEYKLADISDFCVSHLQAKENVQLRIALV